MAIDFSFSTTAATPLTEVITFAKDVTGAALTIEFSDRSDFAAIRLSKTATGAGKSVTVSLTASEVDSFKSGFYRVKSVSGGVTTIVAGGAVHYNNTTPTYAPLNDPRLSKTVSLGNVSGNVALDVSSGSVFVATVTGSTVFSFVNWPAGSVAPEPTVIATQDSAGHPISFSGITWLPLGSTPTFQTGAGQVNVVAFFSVDGGATVYGQGGASSGGGYGVYGDGSDGAYVLDGSTPPVGLGKAGTTYYLMRDVFPSSVTLASGYSLEFGGGATPTYKLSCNGTFTNNGFVVTFPNNPSATGATGQVNLTGGTLKVGAAGANGGVGAGAVGGNVIGLAGGAAGKGGNAGNGTAGGNGGTSSVPAGYTLPRRLPDASLVAFVGPSAPNGMDFWPGGAGGGSGAGDGTNAGGGGGAGGNALYLAARNLVNNGQIYSKAGSGAPGVGGNAGGGGGGQGGPVILIYGTYSGTGSVSSIGGNGGAGAGTGQAGIAGGANFIVKVVN
jgi:hypothetical protein